MPLNIVEVRVKPTSATATRVIREHVLSYITSSLDTLALPSAITHWQRDVTLRDEVESILTTESSKYLFRNASEDGT